mgnify:CR=1 FL=1
MSKSIKTVCHHRSSLVVHYIAAEPVVVFVGALFAVAAGRVAVVSVKACSRHDCQTFHQASASRH